MKGLKIAGNLAKAVDDYHQKRKPSVEASPEVARSEKPGSTDQAQVTHADPADEATELHHDDLSDLEGVVCPSCHQRLRNHMAAKAANAKAPHVSTAPRK